MWSCFRTLAVSKIPSLFCNKLLIKNDAPIRYGRKQEEKKSSLSVGSHKTNVVQSCFESCVLSLN